MADSIVELYDDETNSLIDQLDERKEAYEDYFNELDALEEEQTREQNKDSIVKQMSSLVGALDSSSKSKLKDLKKQLQDLQNEELESQKQKQRDALTESIEAQTKKLNENLDTMKKTLDDLIEAIMNNTDSQASFSWNGSGWDKVIGQETGTITTPYVPTPSVNATNAAVGMLGSLIGKDFTNMLSQTSTTPNIETAEEITNNITIGNIEIKTDHLDTNQDFNEAGNVLADALLGAIKRRGINTNARK